MADAIGRDLACDAFAVLLLEEDEDGPDAGREGRARRPGLRSRARASPSTTGGSGEARAGRDVRRCGRTQPEAVVPLRAEGDADRAAPRTQRHRPAGIDRERLLLLGRLADQIALVVQAARLRARQEETLQRLRELDEMKSDFVAITSHELRTPLAAIRGFVNTLRRGWTSSAPEETHEFLGIVDQQTDRLIRLVEDLLVVSRIEAGKLTLHPEPVELDPFLDRRRDGPRRASGRARIDWREPGPARTRARRPPAPRPGADEPAAERAEVLAAERAGGRSRSQVRRTAWSVRGDRPRPGHPARRSSSGSSSGSTRRTPPPPGARRARASGSTSRSSSWRRWGDGSSVRSELGAGSTFTVMIPATAAAPAPAPLSPAARAD